MRRKLSFRLAGFVLLLAFGHCCVQVAAMPPGDGDDGPNIQAGRMQLLRSLQWGVLLLPLQLRLLLITRLLLPACAPDQGRQSSHQAPGGGGVTPVTTA